ncbi:MAG: flagellar assembly protein FliH [Azoarcus sp.]|jgi:flagellar assembly protein FliH|nr:flagellar assembly protein FliH [Azoarcus sp.]
MKTAEPFARHQAVGAYRRWEPPKFDAPPPRPAEAGRPAPEAAARPGTPDEEAAPALPPGLKLPTAADIERMHEEARRDGYEEGLAEGRDAGYADGRQAGLEEGRETGYREGRTSAEAEAARLREMIAQLDQAFTQLDAEVAEELMSLSIELARKVLQHTLAVEPEAVVSAVRAALQHLPESRGKIHMHPDDVALARKHLAEVLDQGGHLVLEDDSISRGGCRVEAAGAQIDATMETRWRRVLDSLGRQHAPWSGAPSPAPRAGTDDKMPTQPAEGQAPPAPEEK